MLNKPNPNIGTGHGTMAERIRNPFRSAFMRKNFDAIVKVYDERHRNLIHPTGNRCTGNSWASYFWRGFDGVKMDFTGSKDTASYAVYRAGQSVAKAQSDD
jgi:hypothetical protein